MIDPVWASIDLPLIDSMLRRRAPVRVIAFLHATPEAIAAMVALAAVGLRHVILASTRDLVAAFDDALTRWKAIDAVRSSSSASAR